MAPKYDHLFSTLNCFKFYIKFNYKSTNYITNIHNKIPFINYIYKKNHIYINRPNTVI